MPFSVRDTNYLATACCDRPIRIISKSWYTCYINLPIKFLATQYKKYTLFPTTTEQKVLRWHHEAEPISAELQFVIAYPKICIFMGGIKSFKLYNFQILVRSASVVSECINHLDLWPCSDTKHLSLSQRALESLALHPEQIHTYLIPQPESYTRPNRIRAHKLAFNENTPAPMTPVIPSAVWDRDRKLLGQLCVQHILGAEYESWL